MKNLDIPKIIPTFVSDFRTVNRVLNEETY